MRGLCGATLAAAVVVAVGIVGAAPAAGARTVRGVTAAAATRFIEQAKLVGKGGTSEDQQGAAVAISGDGKTAIVGGYLGGPKEEGAVWVFVRTNRGWRQQAELSNGSDEFGTSVSLSRNGDVALVGAPMAGYQGGSEACNAPGAAFVYVRSGSSWHQQAKLVGKGGGSFPQQGETVALSSSGDTALIGAGFCGDEAWAFSRSGSKWHQQAHFKGTDGDQLGSGLALSGRGQTALVGAPGAGGGQGATWVYTRSGSNWHKQATLVGSGAIGAAAQGSSASLSRDGNTALIGGPADDTSSGFYAIGAAWVFTRAGSTWHQQAKLVGSDTGGYASQGTSVSLSADGTTALVGGPFAHKSDGAAWVFARSASGWRQRQQLRANGRPDARNVASGSGLSGDADTALLGAPGAGKNSLGAAFVFSRPTPSTSGAALTTEFRASAEVADAPAQPTYGNELAAITCVSARDCWAVGYSSSPRATVNRVLHWDGREWSRASVPDPRHSVFSQVAAVACTRARDCWAVGGYERPSGATVDEALHWNGAKWKLVATPTPGSSDPYNVHFLTAVACTSEESCWAVGYSTNTDEAGSHNQILRWNGKAWARGLTPNPRSQNGQFNSLLGVTCVAASDCWAVGKDGKRNGNELLRWNGATWSVTPVPPEPAGGALSSVACLSASYCWAVGFSMPGDPEEALRWDGQSWVSVPAPNPGKHFQKDISYLNGVACTSTNECWAVGGYAFDHDQAVRWNGTKWSEAQVPNPGRAGQRELLGVACTSARSCWAVGYNGKRDLALRWRGVAWVNFAVP